MQTLQVLIIEGNSSFGSEFSKIIKEIGYKVSKIVNDISLAYQLIPENKPDIILIDIEVEGGFDFAHKIRPFHIPIIFISPEDDLSFLARIKKLTSVVFLVKPVKKLSLRSSIELAVYSLKNIPKKESGKRNFVFNDYFFAKKNTVVHKVLIHEIIYIESAKNYCVVHLKNKKFVLRTSLSKIETELPSQSFIRAHRSHIINLKKLETMDINENMLRVGQVDLAFGNTYKEKILKAMKPYLKK